MEHAISPTRWSALIAARPALALLAGVGFAMASRVLPLYSVNQNTKFLHGLAWAFPERLGADWLANTVDGLPVFTWIVYLVARYLTPSVFSVLEYALLVACGWALYRIAVGSHLPKRRAVMPYVALAALVALLAVSPGRHVMTGVASQYLIGNYLQPSEFGVLFILSLALVETHPRAALLLAAVPAALHPAYIPIALIMTAAQVAPIWRRRGAGDVAILAVAVLVIVAPQLDLALRFAGQDAALQAEATRIIAFDRIPYHSLPGRWFGPVAAGKLVLALAAIWLAPDGAIRRTLIGLVAFAVLGTLFVAATENASVALLAPWRASVVVMPLSLAIVLGRGVSALFAGLANWERARLAVPVVAICLAALAGGVAIRNSLVTLKRHTETRLDPTVQAARDSPAAGRLYLTEPADAGFRLAAMAPQFISFKSHPYLAPEVIEWRRRASLAEAVFPGDGRGAARGLDCDALLTVLRAYPVTHVVLPARAEMKDGACPWIEPAGVAAPRLFAVRRDRLAE